MSETAVVDLARVTVSAPGRQLDVALPATVPLAALLPSLLRHIGETLPGGEEDGGWTLRRGDGEPLETGRPLATQVRDGDTLYLVPGRARWPEPDYDDLADAIAMNSRRRTASWDGRMTMILGLAVVGVVLAIGFYPVLSFRPGGLLPGAVALAVAAALTGLGGLLARGIGDVRAGTLLAAYALPYAFVGGLVILAPRGSMAGIGAPHLMLASTAVVGFSVLGLVSVGGGGRVFTAGTFAGLLGVVGATVGLWTSGPAAAAVVVAVLVNGVIGLPLLAMRIGRLPLPVVPQTAADLQTNTLPPADSLRSSIVRTEEALAGLLIGAAISHVAAAVVLMAGFDLAAIILVVLTAALNMLRARLFSTLSQRLPLLIAGVVVLGLAGWSALIPLAAGTRLAWGLVGIAVATGVALYVTVTYSRKPPSPYLRRAAEVVDITLILMVIPTAAAVLGLFGRIRGLAG